MCFTTTEKKHTQIWYLPLALNVLQKLFRFRQYTSRESTRYYMGSKKKGYASHIRIKGVTKNQTGEGGG